MKRLFATTAVILTLAGPAFAGDSSTLGHAGASTMTGGTSSTVVPGGSSMTGNGSDGDEARPGGSSMTGGDNLADADTSVEAIDLPAVTGENDNNDGKELGYAGASTMTGGTDSKVVPGGSSMTGAGSDGTENEIDSVISRDEGTDVLKTETDG